MQAKLLRVLEESEFERVGGSHPIKVDVRVIAATNRNLEDAVRKGEFRPDLYYRLNVFPITLPPLRERASDIPLLVQHFVKYYSTRFNRVINSINAQSLQAMQEYHWPGNIRELENLVERAILTADTDVLKITLPDFNLEPA